MSETGDHLQDPMGSKTDFVRSEMTVDNFYDLWREKILDITDGEDHREDATDAFIYEDDQATTYCLEVREFVGERDEQTSIWLLDVNAEGDFAGYGILSKYKDSTVPYVGDTVTEGQFQRTGLASRRLRLMNEVAKQHFGQLLHSSRPGLMEPEAIKVWEKLTLEGLAEPYETEKGRRFQFLA